MELTVAPTRLATAENWFWVSQIKQYVDGESEIKYLSAAEEIEWVRGNIDRVERVLADGLTLETTCEELQARARAVSWSQCG